VRCVAPPGLSLGCIEPCIELVFCGIDNSSIYITLAELSRNLRLAPVQGQGYKRIIAAETAPQACLFYRNRYVLDMAAAGATI
jgi:hypothetical protein